MASEPVARSESFTAFIPEFERLIAEVMEEWKVPGLAVVVVQNGEVAFVRPYGLRDVEAGLKVTTDTQFQSCRSRSRSPPRAWPFWWTRGAWIGRSRCGNTSRNSGCMTPLRPTASRCAIFSVIIPGCRVTIGYGCPAICHPRKCWRQCAIWSRATTFAAPSNTRTSATSSRVWWPNASAVRVGPNSPAPLTDKLHMDVTFTVEELAAAADAAVPYAMEGDTRLRSKLWPVSVTAAGGISTSIASFANWLRFHLGKGEFEGQRLLSPGLIQELQKPRVHVGHPNAEYGDVHYGFGFRTHRYRGERVVWHGGGFTGTNALMMMLPDRGVGVGVLNNNGMTPVSSPHILANYVFDRVCGKEPAPWLDRFRERAPQIRSAART